MGDAFFLKKIYEPAQLSQLQPQKIIAVGGEGRIRIGKKSVDAIAFLQKKRSQIGAVLPGDARDQSCFYLIFLRTNKGA